MNLPSNLQSPGVNYALATVWLTAIKCGLLLNFANLCIISVPMLLSLPIINVYTAMHLLRGQVIEIYFCPY